MSDRGKASGFAEKAPVPACCNCQKSLPHPLGQFVLFGAVYCSGKCYKELREAITELELNWEKKDAS